MAAATVSEDEFVRLWNQTGGSASEVAKILKIDVRGVLQRRVRIENKRGEPLLSTNVRSNRPAKLPPGRIPLKVENGTVLVGSDAHIWGTDYTTGQRAFVKFAEMLKPAVIVVNGDVFDGASISRHPTNIWSHEKRPGVKQEVEACQDFMGLLTKASSASKHIWTWGNHCARFEARLTANAPEYEGVQGFALKDHFPEWAMCMSVWVNDDVVIKHRAGANGLHAVYQNALKGGKSIVTGHLHSLKVSPWTDYNGTRYGVDTGTLADTNGPQFDYMEDNARNWRSGFAVLTFKDGKLLLPELVQVWDEDRVQFRGELISV